MATKTSSSDVSAPNSNREIISDDDLIRGFVLALGAGGRKARTIFIYEDSIRRLSTFARSLGLPILATMDRTVVRHWLSSHFSGDKTGLEDRIKHYQSVGLHRRLPPPNINSHA